MVASYRLCYQLPPLVSLLLGFFQGFGTTRATEDLPMDWIEVVTILVAILTIALVGSWNNRRSDSRCPTRREESVTKVIRNDPERMLSLASLFPATASFSPVTMDGTVWCDGRVGCDQEAFVSWMYRTQGEATREVRC
jgi:hypothetical protein